MREACDAEALSETHVEEWSVAQLFANAEALLS